MPLRIDAGDLLLALETQPEELTFYLDRQTGQILPVLADYGEDGSEEAELEAQVEAHPERYVYIEPVSSHEAWRWMANFAAGVEDDAAAAELERALEHRHPFRSFKDALLAYPELRQEWFRYRDGRLLEYAREWLEAEELDAELVNTRGEAAPAAPLRLVE